MRAVEISAFAIAVKERPMNAPQARRLAQALGVAALQDYDIEAGHGHCDRALEINPNSVNEMVNVGIEALATGRLEQAEMALMHALSIDPARPLARETLEEVRKRKSEDR